MTPGPKRSDSIAEWAIVALVVVVLGVAATQTKLEPPTPSTLTVDEIAARVRMQMPIARDCVRGPDNPVAACGARVAANERP
jgi:hypothetical protein